MLYAFGFDRIAVVAADLFFVDPNPEPGQEGAERGVRLELRMLDRGDLHGSIYSAQPIGVDRPIWRADLLESVAGPVGSFDRTHHHPAFREWEPGRRTFVPELSADPIGWVGARLEDLDRLLADAHVPTDAVGPRDSEELRRAVPEILDAVRRLLDRVHAGELGRPYDDQPLDNARVGWL
ncbi:MAG TPA: hypothetical protein VGQ20_11685 [Acidimicrobiales bacterium]|jgi:hypothetical protein|nr:hypothetical protein [Acidimicrobiales bacterium]